MKCRYVYDEKAGKVLVPGCMGTAALGIENCTCRIKPTFNQFEKQRFNDVVKQKDLLIADLESENIRLTRQIKKLMK